MLWFIALISMWLLILSPFTFLYLLYQKVFWTSTEIIFWFASVDNSWVFTTPLYMIIAAIIFNFIWRTLDKIF
jgi:hypothetical protein